MNPKPFFSCCLTATNLAQVTMKYILCLIWVMPVYRRSQKWQSFSLEMAESLRVFWDSCQVLSHFFHQFAVPPYLGSWNSGVRDLTVFLHWRFIFKCPSKIYKTGPSQTYLKMRVWNCVCITCPNTFRCHHSLVSMAVILLENCWAPYSYLYSLPRTKKHRVGCLPLNCIHCDCIHHKLEEDHCTVCFKLFLYLMSLIYMSLLGSQLMQPSWAICWIPMRPFWKNSNSLSDWQVVVLFSYDIQS